MDPKQAHLLLYGKDSILLSTRQMLFESSHFQVSSTSFRDEFHSLLSTMPFEVLLLCHTLSLEEISSAIAEASSIQPEMETIVITPLHPGLQIATGSKIVSAADGPQVLLAAVRGLVRQ